MSYARQIEKHLVARGVPRGPAKALAKAHAQTGLTNGWFASTMAAAILSCIEWVH